MSDKPPRIFLDTNVLVYAHDVSAGLKHDRARQLVSDLWDTENGCLSLQVLQEFYVTITRKVATPLPPEVASKIVSNLSLWILHEPRLRDLLSAIDIHQKHNISFWDAMILQSAAELGCTTLFSEDLNSAQEYNGVRVVNPFTDADPEREFRGQNSP
jgi:predicted nucleic acid-binding protein